jgi:hypothetical protein
MKPFVYVPWNQVLPPILSADDLALPVIAQPDAGSVRSQIAAL